MLKLYCVRCGAKLIKIAQDKNDTIWKCPTCKDIPASEYDGVIKDSLEETAHIKPFENIGDGGLWVENLNSKIDEEILLNKLPTNQRLVILGRENGWSYKEIATIMGISEQVAKNYHTRAKNRLLLALNIGIMKREGKKL